MNLALLSRVAALLDHEQRGQLHVCKLGFVYCVCKRLPSGLTTVNSQISEMVKQVIGILLGPQILRSHH